MIEDAHAEGEIGFLRDLVTNVTQADNAEGVVAGIMGCYGGILVSVEPFLWAAGSGG